MAGSNKQSGGSGRAAGGKVAPAAVTASATQRNRKAWMDQQGGRARTDLRNSALDYRVRLPKKMRDALGVNTVGGAMRQLARQSYSQSKYGLSQALQDRYSKLAEMTGNTGGRYGRSFAGVNLRTDNAGRRQLDATPLALRQMEIAEKAGSRRRRR